MRLDGKVFVEEDRGAMTVLGQEGGVSGARRSQVSRRVVTNENKEKKYTKPRKC